MIAIVILIIIIISISVFYYNGENGIRIGNDNAKIEIEYELDIYTNTSDAYNLILPIFGNEKLRSKIKITEGEGEISIVSTNVTDLSVYSTNVGLQVYGANNLKIYGKHVIKYDGKKHTDDVLSLFKDYSNSSSNYWTWCEKGFNQEISIVLEASFTTYTDGEYWESINNDRNSIELDNGWNLINIEERSWET